MLIHGNVDDEGTLEEEEMLEELEDEGSSGELTDLQKVPIVTQGTQGYCYLLPKNKGETLQIVILFEGVLP